MLAPIYIGLVYNEPLSLRIPASLGHELQVSNLEMLQHPGLPPKNTADIVTAAMLIRPRLPFPVVIDVLKASSQTVMPKPQVEG